MRRKLAVGLVVLSAVLLSGCTTLGGLWPKDPQAQLAVAADTYAITLQTATDLYEAGYVSQEAMEQIGMASVIVRTALDAWQLALAEDHDPAAARQRFDEALARMRAIIDEGGTVADDTG